MSIETIFLTISAIALGICAYNIIIGSLEIRECNRIIKRNEEVYRFRATLIEANFELFKKLPDYDAMVYSNLPLELKYWIK